MEDIVIVSAARTAVGKFGGSLAKTPAADLGAIVIREAIARAGLSSDQIGEVIMGQVLAAGVGQNPARQASMKAGVAKETPALTINAVCGSGLKAGMLAAQAVAWAASITALRPEPHTALMVSAGVSLATPAFIEAWRAGF